MSVTRTTRTGARPGLDSTDLALVAALAALVAVCALLPAIPVGVNGVPLTLQVFGVFLAGAVLGARRGFIAVLLYLVVGVAGLPVFAQGQAGTAPFTGTTGGYLVGFAVAAPVIGLAVERLRGRGVAVTAVTVFAACLAGEVVLFLLGGLGIARAAHLPIGQGLTAAAPFVPADLVKSVLVAIVAAATHRAFPQLLRPRP